MTTRKTFRLPIVLTDHVFDKIRSIDMTMAEFERLLRTGEIIEEEALSSRSSKELILLLEWTRPLHIVVVVDEGREEERILTVYEPDPARWDADFRSGR